MKILAIEKETAGTDWGQLQDLLMQEARHVYQLYLSDALREIYFTENKNAVLVLEAPDTHTALQLLQTLPLVKSGKIAFELMELHPYSGYERIMK